MYTAGSETTEPDVGGVYNCNAQPLRTSHLPKSEEGKQGIFTVFPSHLWKIEKTKLITGSSNPP